MEKVMKPYDKEYMKISMLKHEETFKQQVYELHRLYRVQKSLMRHIDCSRPSKQRWGSYSRNGMIRLNDQINEVVSLEIEEGEIELTLGPSSYYLREKAKTPPTSDSGQSFSSSSSSPGARGELTGHRWGLTMVSESNPGAPWLFQPLGLNIT